MVRYRSRPDAPHSLSPWPNSLQTLYSPSRHLSNQSSMPISCNINGSSRNSTFHAVVNFKVRNVNLSHIITGHIGNFPSQGFVRVNEVFDDKLASSLFDYTNVTDSGLVDNTLTTYEPASTNSTEPDVWRGYVNSNFPIFQKDILIGAGAVFEGLVKRDFVRTPVAAVRLFLQFIVLVCELISRSVEHHVSGCNPCDGLCW